MDRIRIVDLEVFYQVGVTEEERARPQRLLITIEIEHDFKNAIAADNLADTIDYHAVSQRVLGFGEGRHWQLIETVAADLATMVLDEFRAKAVTVEVKKFIIRQADYVSVIVHRNHG